MCYVVAPVLFVVIGLKWLIRPEVVDGSHVVVMKDSSLDSVRR